ALRDRGRGVPSHRRTEAAGLRVARWARANLRLRQRLRPRGRGRSQQGQEQDHRAHWRFPLSGVGGCRTGLLAWVRRTGPRHAAPPAPSLAHQARSGTTFALAATNKSLAQINKSGTGREATNKRETATNADPLTCQMKPTTKIRFTEPQIALVMRAHQT